MKFKSAMLALTLCACVPSSWTAPNGPLTTIIRVEQEVQSFLSTADLIVRTILPLLAYDKREVLADKYAHLVTAVQLAISATDKAVDAAKDSSGPAPDWTKETNDLIAAAGSLYSFVGELQALVAAPKVGAGRTVLDEQYARLSHFKK